MLNDCAFENFPSFALKNNLVRVQSKLSIASEEIS